MSLLYSLRGDIYEWISRCLNFDKSLHFLNTWLFSGTHGECSNYDCDDPPCVLHRHKCIRVWRSCPWPVFCCLHHSLLHLTHHTGNFVILSISYYMYLAAFPLIEPRQSISTDTYVPTCIPSRPSLPVGRRGRKANPHPTLSRDQVFSIHQVSFLLVGNAISLRTLSCIEGMTGI